MYCEEGSCLQLHVALTPVRRSCRDKIVSDFQKEEKILWVIIFSTFSSVADKGDGAMLWPLSRYTNVEASKMYYKFIIIRNSLTLFFYLCTVHLVTTGI